MIEDNSNPSYADAVNNMQQTNTQNISDVKFSGILNAQATLALAYEQRTANLIAWASEAADDEGLRKLNLQIAARLGLDGAK